MNRLLELETRYNEFIERQDPLEGQRDESLAWERIHMASSASEAWRMAEELGEDPEIAACAAAVHDIGRVVTGRQAGHAEAGYEPAKAFLKATGLFDEEEIEIIAAAVRKHSSKTECGTILEEIVKDADVIDCFRFGYPFDRPEKEQRYHRWKERRMTAKG
ncbi:MAG: HD domain-containing protein [Firmicutes bacterium]|nr:HD domain-containing protein [Bacillota bacterium]